MSTPKLSILIPTQGRPTLERCLASYAPQLRRGDEVLVMIDTHQMETNTLDHIARRVGEFGKQFKPWGHDAGHHCYGHCPNNRGIELAREGSYLVWNDDDDIATGDALALVRAGIMEHAEPRPHIFCFRAPWGQVLGTQVGHIAEGHIGGHQFVTPNIPGKVGRWSCRYQGDYDLIRSTLTLWGNDAAAAWHPGSVIAVARP